LVFLQDNDDEFEGNDDNLEVLKIMRKVEQKIKFRTAKNEIDLITEVDVSIRILTNVIDYTMLRSSMSHEHQKCFKANILYTI
jgi:hypothetical protein